MGKVIFYGTCTLVGASLLVLPSSLWILKQFGIITVITCIISSMVALFSFSSICHIVGPENGFADIEIALPFTLSNKTRKACLDPMKKCTRAIGHAFIKFIEFFTSCCQKAKYEYNSHKVEMQQEIQRRKQIEKSKHEEKIAEVKATQDQDKRDFQVQNEPMMESKS